MYEVSDQWKAGKIAECTKTGYATVAFGLRVRTPMLNKVVLGTRSTPFKAEAEARTVGNAFGQSYCMLNNRTGNEINTKARASKYRLDIRPSLQIHDANYWLVRDDLDTLVQLNKWVGEGFAWQGLPEIQHDEVGLSGELDLFYPTWAEDVTIPNDATKAELIQICNEEALKRKEK